MVIRSDERSEELANKIRQIKVKTRLVDAALSDIDKIEILIAEVAQNMYYDKSNTPLAELESSLAKLKRYIIQEACDMWQTEFPDI
jgi:hypothetical protein